MAERMSIREYLTSFLLRKPEDGKESKFLQNIALIVVYKTDQYGSDEVIYTKKILGSKSIDPLVEFVKDMTGTYGKMFKNFSTNQA